MPGAHRAILTTRLRLVNLIRECCPSIFGELDQGRGWPAICC